jgi:hypothetical protein
MSRGKRPVVAIGEAKRSAVAAGFMLIELVTAAVLPFDFAVDRDGESSVVRVRRLKQAGFRIENILRACKQELKELRERSVMKGLIAELWVRGPARTFHRYRVLPDTVEELGMPATQPAVMPPVSGNNPETPPDAPEKKSWITRGEIIDEPYVKESPFKLAQVRELLADIRREAKENDARAEGEDPA